MQPEAGLHLVVAGRHHPRRPGRNRFILAQPVVPLPRVEDVTWSALAGAVCVAHVAGQQVQERPGLDDAGEHRSRVDVLVAERGEPERRAFSRGGGPELPAARLHTVNEQQVLVVSGRSQAVERRAKVVARRSGNGTNFRIGFATVVELDARRPNSRRRSKPNNHLACGISAKRDVPTVYLARVCDRAIRSRPQDHR